MSIHRFTTLLFIFLFQFSIGALAQNAKILIAQGDSLLENNSANKAMEKYNAALDLGATADAYVARARGWFTLGKYDKFMTDVRSALGLDSMNVKANYQRAVFAAQSEDHFNTVLFATRVINIGTDSLLSAKSFVLRGEAEAALGMTDKAIADLAEGLKGNTEDLLAMKTLARLYDKAGDPAASLAVLEKLCALQPDDIGNWTNRGYELSRLERYAEAMQVLDQALAMDKDEPVVLSNKAYAQLKLGLDADAFTNVNRSLKSDPTNPYALCTRGMLYLRKGDRKKACNDLTFSRAMGGAPEVDSLIKDNCSGMPKKR